MGLGGAEPNGRGGARRSELTSGGDVTLCPILFYHLLPRTLTYSIQGTADEQMKGSSRACDVKPENTFTLETSTYSWRKSGTEGHIFSPQTMISSTFAQSP